MSRRKNLKCCVMCGRDTAARDSVCGKCSGNNTREPDQFTFWHQPSMIEELPDDYCRRKAQPKRDDSGQLANNDRYNGEARDDI